MSDQIDRFLRWVGPSHRLAPAEAMLVVIVQNLGRMDATLIFQTIPSLSADASDIDALDHLESFNDHLTHSYLWVLGAYELVRTLDQRARKGQLFDERARERIAHVKNLFARVRIPLAKFEPASAHSDTDFAVAWPIENAEHGAGWRVAPHTFITRRDLADSLLELLESLPEP